MKKILSMLLVLCAVLSLVACGSSEAAPTTTEAALEFRVGYSKVNITPDEPTELSGYSDPDGLRKHTQVWDYLYLTCVAISDTEDNTLLMFSCDVVSISDTFWFELRELASKTTGVPEDHIHINCSHTHSAPRGQGISEIMRDAIKQASKEAMEDRKPAQMSGGTANTSGISFVRHYYKDDGTIVADNHNSDTGTKIVGHTTQADEEMRVLQFVREGGKPVIMVSWQCHPHITGGSKSTIMSADIVGAFRTNMENDLDCLFAYYQGGAGNINPTSRIKEENVNSKEDWNVHGQMLADTAKKALENMTPLETGIIKVVGEDFTCKTNKEELDKVAAALDVRKYYSDGHSIGETAKYAKQYGIWSIYHANSIVNRSSLPNETAVDIYAVSFGDFGWAMGPYEMFDESAKYIRENSPCAFTFATGYAHSGIGYVPTLTCWEYGSYESDTARLGPGSAEALAERFVQLLEQLNAN